MRREAWAPAGVIALGVLASLLVGTTATLGGMIMRGVVAGCVAGLSCDGWDGAPRAGLLGLVASLAGAAAAFAVLSSMGISLDGSPVAGFAGAVLAGLLTSLLMGALAAWSGRTVAAWVGFALVVGIFLSTVGVLPGQNAQLRAENIRRQAAIEPVADGTEADHRIYRKTYFLMQRSVPFYEAWAQAFSEEGVSAGRRPANMFQYRPPSLFLLWQALPGPADVRLWWWFAVFAIAGMAFAYGCALRFVGPAAAILVPIGLSAYFAMPLMTLYFVFAEFWGVMFALAFLYFLASDRPIAAALALVAAVAVRELFAYLLPAYVIWWALSPARGSRRRLAALGLAVGLPVILSTAHAMMAKGSGGAGTDLSAWLNGGLDALTRTLRFSGDLALGSGWLYLAAPVVAVAGALLIPRREVRFALVAAVAVPVILLTAFSGGETGLYWGAIAGPLMLTLWPLGAAGMVPAPAADAGVETPPIRKQAVAKGRRRRH